MSERLVQTPMDRYVVLEYIAEGGMGAIYRGKKLGAGGFEKEVVLKQLLPEFTQQPEFIDLFLREARLTAALDHANIVHTIDLVRAADEYFIVMEYVRGGDLRTLLKRIKRRKKRLMPAAAIFIAREILSALSYAHQKVGPDGTHMGLIHRDVSPSNVLCSGAGEVKLTDFGIAKATTHRSVFYRVKGKIGYMSPEQARGQQLQPRSDLYSAAVVLYEMLTGERLFVAVSITTSPDQMYGIKIPAVSDKVAGKTKDLDAVMWKALSIDPDQRYQTAGEFQEALLRVAHRNGLMMGAADLGRHLVDVCGPIAEWGSTNVVEENAGEGTGVDDGMGGFGQGTEQIPAIALLEKDLQQTAAEKVPSVERATSQLPASALDFGPEPTPGSRGIADIADMDEDLLWVDELATTVADPTRMTGPHPLARSRHETHNETGRLASVELTSVIAADLEKFITERVEQVEPTVMRKRPRRSRAWLAVGALALLGAGVALAIGLTGPDLQTSSGAPAPVKPPAAKPTSSAAPALVKLTIDSDPAKAKVSLDGKARCLTPCTVDGVSPAATTSLRVDKDGYLPWTAFVVAPGTDPTQATQHAKLRKDPGKNAWGLVEIQGPGNANVLVNGKPIGWITPAPPLPLPPGEWTVSLAGKPHEMKVVVRAGTTSRVDLSTP